jgi:hypothetical protein
VGDGLALAGFQLFSALLLLAAAASSYLAGSGVLKALSRVGLDGTVGLLPEPFRRENRFLVAHWGVVLVLVIACAMLIGSGAREQALVQFYAVAVFASFFAATVSCARLSLREGRRWATAANVAGAALVAFVLGLNLTRLDSAIALAASLALALYLWWLWRSRGRPAGVVRVSTQ